jgi:hypothetical protein
MSNNIQISKQYNIPKIVARNLSDLNVVADKLIHDYQHVQTFLDEDSRLQTNYKKYLGHSKQIKKL